MTETTYLIICIVALIIVALFLEYQARQIKKLKKENKRLQAQKQSDNKISI